MFFFVKVVSVFEMLLLEIIAVLSFVVLVVISNSIAVSVRMIITYILKTLSLSLSYSSPENYQANFFRKHIGEISGVPSLGAMAPLGGHGPQGNLLGALGAM